MSNAVIHNTSVTASGLAKMLVQYQGRPRMAALLSAWLDEFQAIEDALYDVYTSRLLYSGPTGDLLAKIGKIVGQDSEGLSDALFAILIQARIKANRSTGRRQDLIDIASILVPGATIFVKDYPPAAVYLYPEGALTLPPVLVGKDFLARAVSAGVLLMFVWSSYTPANTFTLGSTNGSVAVPTVNQALGSTNGSVTTGGKLAGVVQVEGGSV